ncbi:MAG: phosphate ABC transporter substrate-binding protein PstS [Acidimicrobiales bacterium]|nr:phosphate ABC transporter substrate-binding protein PstS [Acidimicrobiales bacterium]
MKKTRVLTRLGALVVVGALFTSACSSKDPDTVDSSDTTTESSESVEGLDIDYSALKATLNASGATFQAPLQEALKAAFLEVAPDVTVNYGGGGSGKGKTDLQGGVVDYAGSDSLVKDEDIAKYKGEFLYFPVAAAPITVAYQLEGVDELQLSPDTLAKIFQAEIKTWNDPAIKADNPDATLPATPIVVAHRSDGSGTTNNFTSYLTKAAPTAWKLGKGDTVAWDSSTQAGNGNQGVAQLVGTGSGTNKGTNGAIGYVDFSDAKAIGLKTAAIKNAAGEFVEPTLAGVTAALAEVTLNANLTYDPLNAAGEDAYPIAAPTWMLVYKNQTDKAKGLAVQGLLNFLYTDGQAIYGAANYAQLPASFREKAIAQLKTLVIPT